MKNNDDLNKRLAALRKLIDAHDDLGNLLDQSTSWSDQINKQQEKSRAIAWRVTAGAAGVTVLALGIAWTAIRTAYVPPAPPAVLVADSTTGLVKPLISLPEVQESMPDAQVKHYLSEFMRCREGYVNELAEHDYYCAAAFMSPQLQSQWAQFWDTTNPGAPFNVYRNLTHVYADINTITLHTNGFGVQDGATIRFTRHVKSEGRDNQSRWVATIAYKYVNEPTDERDRRTNPVGLQVQVYQVDPDIGGDAYSTAPQRPAPQTHTPTAALAAPRTGDVQ